MAMPTLDDKLTQLQLRSAPAWFAAWGERHRLGEEAAAREVDAVISAGNTGACVAACQLRMRTLAGVGRPGIAVIIPSLHGPIVICDVGANIAPKPFHLLQYAQMATQIEGAPLR